MDNEAARYALLKASTRGRDSMQRLAAAFHAADGAKRLSVRRLSEESIAEKRCVSGSAWRN